MAHVIYLLLLAACGGYIFVLKKQDKRNRVFAANVITETHYRHRRELASMQNAYERGMAEIEESYQQEALEQYDKLGAEIERLSLKNKDLIEERDDFADHLEHHFSECLPHLSDIRLMAAIRKEEEEFLTG